MIKVDVFTEGCRLPYKKMTARSISRLAAAAADKTGIENALITVIITDDGFIREMNREYRKKDSPTDVISFANRDCEFPDIESEPEDLGDIFISIETAERQAAEYGVSLKDEIKRLVIHGVLHLAGYDHEKSEKHAAVMARKEREIYESIA
ncbi:MAG TPA: rRNA maturation RNase YbeY [Spirochaetota bacterium]|nr:rRNA maturation RNase YbeY [Spirochaetota bacterium]HRZ27078.1 rRNA maturation RNase YbeY [Spirochaetota bacterium]HSA13137.1 rRNA maturation RNase YbeY [Spirochaetota bacterium]